MRAKNYVPRTAHEMAQTFGFDRKDVLKLKKTLADMVKNGTIAKVKGDRYGGLEDLDLVSGIIDFRPSGRAFMKLADGSTVEFRPEDTGVSLNGDKVLARIIPDDRRRFAGSRGAFGKKSKRQRTEKAYVADSENKYGRVIRILERKNAKVVGTLRRSYHFWHVVPDDPRFFYDIIVGDPQKSAALPVPVENDKVVVRMNEWTQRHINPSGEIVDNLGESHTPMAEYKAILVKYDLSETFPPNVVNEVDRVPSEVSKKDIDGRCDMRGKFTVTIDPEDAKDFDDAISIEQDAQGWEIGVHIADVSYYVRQNSAIDKEAQARGNSTYLVGTVLPMLPFELSNGICSLVEDKDRLVKSVFMRFDDNGECKSARFANSVIRSDKRLSYEQAHALITENSFEKILEAKPPQDYETAFSGKPLSELTPEKLKNLQAMLRKMWSIASALRKRRMKNGSFDLDMPEFKIFCDKEGYADRIEKIEYNESHQLIEEFMLAANESVARELFSNHIPYISRVHDDPDVEKLSGAPRRTRNIRHTLRRFDLPKRGGQNTCGNRKKSAKLHSENEVPQESQTRLVPRFGGRPLRFEQSLLRALYIADTPIRRPHSPSQSEFFDEGTPHGWRAKGRRADYRQGRARRRFGAYIRNRAKQRRRRKGVAQNQADGVLRAFDRQRGIVRGGRDFGGKPRIFRGAYAVDGLRVCPCPYDARRHLPA